MRVLEVRDSPSLGQPHQTLRYHYRARDGYGRRPHADKPQAVFTATKAARSGSAYHRRRRCTCWAWRVDWAPWHNDIGNMRGAVISVDDGHLSHATARGADFSR